MVEYKITIKKDKGLGSENHCFQTWISFFSILKKIPKAEYVRYTEGFLFSLRKENDVSLGSLVSTIFQSSDLKFYFQQSFSVLDQESILYLLNRAEKMWPQEKDITFRLRAIIKRNPAHLFRKSYWLQKPSLDFLNYLLTGRRTEVYIENVSRRSISSKRLENILSFPLVNRRFNA